MPLNAKGKTSTSFDQHIQFLKGVIPAKSAIDKSNLKHAHFNSYTTTHILDKQLGNASGILDKLDDELIERIGVLSLRKDAKFLESASQDVECDCGKFALEACPCHTEKVRSSKFPQKYLL